MSAVCSFCLESKPAEEVREKFRCSHKFCRDCEEVLETENVLHCVVDDCRSCEWCRHGDKFIAYCADDFELLCQFCIGLHEGHDLRDLSALDRDVKRERDKAYTENFKAITGIVKDCEKLEALMQRVKQKVGQVRDLAAGSEFSLEEFGIVDGFIGKIGFDCLNVLKKENCDLRKRAALLRYLQMDQDYILEMVTNNQVMEMVNCEIEKRGKVLEEF